MAKGKGNRACVLPPMEGVSPDRQRLARQAWEKRQQLEDGDEGVRADLAELEDRLDGRVYRLPAEELPALERELGKAVRRAERMGAFPPLFQVTDEDLEECTVSSSGLRSARKVVTLVLTDADVSPAEGWRYLGYLIHVKNDHTDLCRLPGSTAVDLSAFQHQPPMCDHCHTNRRRVRSFLVEGPDKTVRQVGSSCLQDYIGAGTPDEAARYAESLLNLTELLAESERRLRSFSGWGAGSDPASTGFFDPAQYMGWVAQSADQDGWRSRRQAFDTGGVSSAAKARTALLGALTGSHASLPNDEQTERGEAAIAWARKRYAGDRSTLSSYERDLARVLDEPLVAYRSLPLLASLLPLYERESAREAARAASPSKHLGTIGDRLELQVRVLAVATRDTDFGRQHIYQLQDDVGNLLTWFSTGRASLEEGQQYQLRGTVKRHDEYEGLPRTVLTRCTVR